MQKIKKKSTILNKKGDIPSLIISLIVILFVVGLSALIFSKVFLGVIGEMKNEPDFQKSNRTISTMTLVENKTIPFLDYLFFFSFIAVFIGIIIASLYIDIHPAIAGVLIIFLIVAIVLAGIFSNVFTSVGEESELSSTYSQFNLTSLVINHLPLWVLAAGVIVIIILFSKGRSGGTV